MGGDYLPLDFLLSGVTCVCNASVRRSKVANISLGEKLPSGFFFSTLWYTYFLIVVFLWNCICDKKNNLSLGLFIFNNFLKLC